MKKIDPNSKLKNIETINKMLSGEHFTQTKTTVGYRKQKPSKKIREVGEVWEEEDPNGNIIVWEQKEGYRVKRRKNLKSLYDLKDYVNKYNNCHKEKCTSLNTRLDLKFKKLTGRCADCHFEFERRLKREGKYEEYSKNFVKQRVEGFIKEAEQDKAALKSALEEVSFPNSDGTEDKYYVPNKEYMLNKIDSDFEKLREDLIKWVQEEEE